MVKEKGRQKEEEKAKQKLDRVQFALREVLGRPARLRAVLQGLSELKGAKKGLQVGPAIRVIMKEVPDCGESQARIVLDVLARKHYITVTRNGDKRIGIRITDDGRAYCTEDPKEELAFLKAAIATVGNTRRYLSILATCETRDPDTALKRIGSLLERALDTDEKRKLVRLQQALADASARAAYEKVRSALFG